MAQTGPVLSVTGAQKFYGRLRALDRVDLTLRPGEFVALLGPNGAGKSTLFQILTGLFSPDGGKITIAGHDLSRHLTMALSSVGVVFQQPTLDLELSVKANLLYHADLHGMDRPTALARINEALDRFSLAGRGSDKVRTLSGGNRRRVELARALLHAPSLLLMDEATVGLDPAGRRDMIDHILRLRDEESLAILWATHLVDEAERADRIVVLHRGRILFDGRKEDLLATAGATSVESAFLRLTGSDGTPADAALVRSDES